MPAQFQQVVWDGLLGVSPEAEQQARQILLAILWGHTGQGGVSTDTLGSIIRQGVGWQNTYGGTVDLRDPGTGYTYYGWDTYPYPCRTAGGELVEWNNSECQTPLDRLR